MRAVWKYPLKQDAMQVVDMPEGAEILHVDKQGEWLCIWAGVNPDEDSTQARIIQIVGTGHRELPDTGIWHLGTVLIGSFVWHVFEVLDNYDNGGMKV